MESFTHESDESSSCTQSDGDSTNSSNGTNPFLLCPRANSSLHLQLGGHGRTHDLTEDRRPYKLARMEPPRHHPFHSSAIANPQGASPLQFPHNVVGAIRGSDGFHSSTFLSQSRSYTSSALEDCRGPSAQAVSAARSHHGSLPYLGPTQSFFTPDQWAELRQQTYVLKHVAAGSPASSALLVPVGCKVENVPINFGNNAGSFFLGLADAQPGRCRRTDGKKWRCGRAVVPDQKYCERHMHRGRGRSKAARLAKLNATVDANQPLSSTGPLNQPLIQLLNQLAVPIQPPDPVQQPPIPAQPLNWLSNKAQPFLQPHAYLPYLAQPLHAEPLSQPPNPSKPLDWPLNQLPMQAEPLNLVQSYGEPPVLAHAIPMNTVSEIKSRSNPSNGSVIKEARRMAHADDHDDVFKLDVQGIKRLLENAPCSMRSRNLVDQPKQFPNVADLLNVAHFRSQPKQPPSLMDILKMVDPGATQIPTASVVNHQLQHTAKDNGIVPANCRQIGGDSTARRRAGAPLSLAVSDEQAAEEQSRKYSSSTGSLNLLVRQPKEDMMSLNLFKVKSEREEEGEEGAKGGKSSKHIEGAHLLPLTRANTSKIRGPSTILEEGCENHITNVSSSMTSNSASGGRSELPVLVEESRDCFGSSAMFEKASSNWFEKRNGNSAELNQNTLHLIEGHLANTDGNSPNLVKTSLNCHKYSPRLDINSTDSAEEGCDHFTEPEIKSLVLREEGFNHHECSSRSERGNEASVKPEKSIPSLLEKGLELQDGSASLDTENSMDLHENSAKLDMNSPILVDESLGNHVELEKNSTSSSSPMEVLQTKATFDRSSSGSCCNANSSSTTLNLDPAALNMNA